MILDGPAVAISWVLVLIGLQIYLLLVLPLAENFFFASCFRFFRRTLLVYHFLLRLCFLGCCMFFLFLLTRFDGRLSFRVCAAGLMLLLLSLVIFCFLIFLLTPCFVGFMTGSASLISISFSSFSIFILFVVGVILALFLHCFTHFFL